MGRERSAAADHAPRQWRRAALEALATLVLAAQCAGIGHELLQRHELCREHGELIHVGEAHAHAASASRPVDAGNAVREAEPSAPHEHEHCGLACSRARLAIAPQASMPLPLVALAPMPGAPVCVAAPDCAELHRLAPKQSPPV